MKHQLTTAHYVSHRTGDPAHAYEDWRTLRGWEPGLLLVDFSLAADWIGEGHVLELTAIYCLGVDQTIYLSVVDKTLVCSEQDPARQYELWLTQHKVARVELGKALPLSPVFIPKPWGQEIWYTGVERRGVSSVAGPQGQTPIPWIQAAMPEHPIGLPQQPLVLLKILDPVATAVQGDLYFELHEEKREVYVVTSIDREAWPDGVGYIRYGFSPDKLAEFASDETFRQGYLTAVQDYEQLRRTLDGERKPPGVMGKAPVSPSDSTLIFREQTLRAAMDSYTHLRPLQVGDVVKVPLLTPHSLQHGVRTIEFQTPVYERKILSFAQRVVTQKHWDTTEAVAQMNLHTPPDTPFTTLRDDEQTLIERIVDFDDFEVQRVRISSSAALASPAPDNYVLVIAVTGFLLIDGNTYGPEQALILPRRWAGKIASSGDTEAVSFLLAIPRHMAVES